MDTILNPIPAEMIKNEDWGSYHTRYTGCGSGIDDDYWDCYCLRDGCTPPKTLDQLNKWTRHNLLEWYEKYKFNFIICSCACCHGAIPRIIIGWLKPCPQRDKNTYIWPQINKSRAERNLHGFYVRADKNLIYHDFC